MNKKIILVAILLQIFTAAFSQNAKRSFTISSNSFQLDGKRLKKEEIFLIDLQDPEISIL